MKYALIAALLSGSAAHAESQAPYPGFGTYELPDEVMLLPTEVEGALFEVLHVNMMTEGAELEEFVTFDTEAGPITVVLDRTANADCSPGCPDILSIVSMPDGLIAIPRQVVTAEASRSAIVIYEFLGY